MRRMYAPNQVALVSDVADIKKLSNEEINRLKAGDLVIKKEPNGENHTYVVAYKKSNEMSLVYADAHNVEEVYYEKQNGSWTHVVTEITPIEITKAPSGTIQDVLGLDSDGKLVKGSISGGTKLYLHNIALTITTSDGPAGTTLKLISSSNEPASLYEVPVYMGGGYGINIKSPVCFANRNRYIYYLTAYTGNNYGVHYYSISQGSIADNNVFNGATSARLDSDTITEL